MEIFRASSLLLAEGKWVLNPMKEGQLGHCADPTSQGPHFFHCIVSLLSSDAPKSTPGLDHPNRFLLEDAGLSLMQNAHKTAILYLDFHFWGGWQEAASCEEGAGGVQKQRRRDQAGPGARAEGATYRSRANRDFKMASSDERRALQHSHSVGIEGDPAPPVTAQPCGDRRMGSRG